MISEQYNVAEKSYNLFPQCLMNYYDERVEKEERKHYFHHAKFR